MSEPAFWFGLVYFLLVPSLFAFITYIHANNLQDSSWNDWHRHFCREWHKIWQPIPRARVHK